MKTDKPELHDPVCWDMSCKGAEFIYSKCQARNEKWTMPKITDMPADIGGGGQCTFNAIWGSFCEDFSLLGWMTDKKQWMPRKEMGGFTINYGTAKESILIDMPALKL